MFELTYEYHSTVTINDMEFNQIIVIVSEIVTTFCSQNTDHLYQQYPFDADKEQSLIEQASKTYPQFKNFDQDKIKVRVTGLSDKLQSVSTMAS